MKSIIVQNKDISITEEQLYGFDELEAQCRSFGKKGDKICLICNDTCNGFALILRNYVSPIIFDGFYNPYGSQELLNEDNDSNGGNVMTSEELKEHLQGYQYVLIMHPSETFIESYGTLFEDENTIKNGTIYGVDSEENKDFQLTYIGQASVEAYF